MLSDFDGTIVPLNCVNLIFDRFGAPECKEIAARWDRGEISQKQEYALGFATVHATREEMEAVLDDVPMDPRFPPFVELCRQRGVPLAIVSDGLKWYIERILARNGVHGVPIYACDIRFLNPGYEFIFPYFEPSAPLRGVSKRHIVQSYQAQGYSVAFIGDGNNDMDAAEVADIVFARASLLERAQRVGLSVIPFTNFGEIARALFDFGIAPIASAQLS